jgi:ubiquinone/menaquinone biosynthesis C-methylase UbiE
MGTVYDSIGAAYNSTRKADRYLTARLLYFLNPQPHKQFLDIGCGTGNYTIALANSGLNFTGVEPSESMINVARKRDQTINWITGSAEQIPVNDNTFDGVIATLTIHHWTDINQSLKEIYRVTNDDGILVTFTATPAQMKGYWLNHYFPQMMADSTLKMLCFDVINSALINAGFELATIEKYFINEGLQDHFLYAGKHHPEIYFDKKIRKGISSFTSLANGDEVRKGLSKLYSDIESGEFEKIKSSYDNDLGDYMFIVAKKIK